MIESARTYLSQSGWLTLFAIVGVGARVLYSHEPITIVRVIWLAVAGLFVGALAGLALSGTDFAEPTKGAIIGIACVLSEDLLTGLLRLGHAIKENPGKLGEILMGRFLGGR